LTSADKITFTIQLSMFTDTYSISYRLFWAVLTKIYSLYYTVLPILPILTHTKSPPYDQYEFAYTKTYGITFQGNSKHR